MTTDSRIPPDYSTVVVGTDGSDLAIPTVLRATRVAQRTDADLVLVSAWSQLGRREQAKSVASSGDTRASTVIGRAAANAALASAVALATEHGATVAAALMVRAEPAAALLETAAERGADLIIIGAAGQPSLAERLLGTVASELIVRAECDVLIVRPTRGQEIEVGRPESA